MNTNRHECWEQRREPRIARISRIGERPAHTHNCEIHRRLQIFRMCWASLGPQRSQKRIIRGLRTFETRSFPKSLAATRRGFTFYLANPVSSIPQIHQEILSEIIRVIRDIRGSPSSLPWVSIRGASSLSVFLSGILPDEVLKNLLTTNEHESVHSSEGMILPTNHTNRRERNSGTKITKAVRVFGVFRGQIAYFSADRRAGRDRATPAGRSRHECQSIPRGNRFLQNALSRDNGGPRVLRERFQTAAELATAERPYGHSSVSPASCSSSARRFISSNLPAAASAFICLSHSSSGRRGRNSAINSQYSRGESLAMASLISATVDIVKHYKT